MGMVYRNYCGADYSVFYCQRIAELKGHYEKRYFWITFFLWIVGMLLVIALPDLKNRELLQRGQSESSDASLPEI